ncbi:Mediator of RNA polymerase II transcription subunit 31 [Aphelenchoides besseyi]|nr:Mediator of RNA polymerase II transcription subunit 31 [Aphelenchoides besseyi]
MNKHMNFCYQISDRLFNHLNIFVEVKLDSRGGFPSSSIASGYSFPPVDLLTPSSRREETPEEAHRRFEIECEFVQALANPHYLNYLAQRGYFKEQYFVNYLKYLLYFKRPEYARTLKFPQCLYMLEAIQSSHFRDALILSANAKYIEDQLLLQWHFYLRKRARIFQLAQNEQLRKRKRKPDDDEDKEPEEGDDDEQMEPENEEQIDEPENDENVGTS